MSEPVITIQITAPAAWATLAERTVRALEALAEAMGREIVTQTDEARVEISLPPSSPPTGPSKSAVSEPSASGLPSASPPVPEKAEPPVALTRSAAVTKFTPARIAVLMQEFPKCRSAASKEALLARLNRLPGDQIASVGAMTTKFYDLRNSAPAAPASSSSTSNDEAKIPAPARASAAEDPWTGARKIRLKTMWEDGDEVMHITAALNRLEGPTLTENAVIRKAGAMMLRRPVTDTPPSAPREVIINGPATIEEIKDWFRSVGGVPESIPTEERFLVAARALRERMGLPTLEVRR